MASSESRRIRLACAWVATAASLALLPMTALAFCPNKPQVMMPPTVGKGKWSILHLRNTKGGYSSMPPSSSPTISWHGKLFKVFKRDVYPTVVLPAGNDTLVDHYFMGMALQQAQHAWDKGEVPIGALIVRECSNDNDDVGDDLAIIDDMRQRTFQILSAAHNRVETDIDASAHAEMLALRRGARNVRNWRFPPDSRLYSTLEPCPMCMASIQAFRIDHIVYGALDNRLGAVKTHMDLLSAAKHPYHEVKSVTEGVRKEECGDVMVNFFRERRRKKKETKGGRRELVKLRPKKNTDDSRGTKRKRLSLGALMNALKRE